MFVAAWRVVISIAIPVGMKTFAAAFCGAVKYICGVA
jgi:hypothetical protein